MPRVTSKKIETKDLQGEGSYVVLRKMSYGDTKQSMKFLALGDVSQREDMSSEEKLSKMNEEAAFTESMIFNGVVEWNWSDENGNALPVPRKAEDLDKLTMEEVSFLVTALTTIPESVAKNSESGSSTISGSAETTTPPPTSG